jgi:transcriptional regulator with XRE-family HTH domain
MEVDDVTLNELIGERMRYYRTKLEISQAEMGKRIGGELGLAWTRQTVWEAETGRRSFRVEDLIALARVVDKPARLFLQPATASATVDWPSGPLKGDDLQHVFRPPLGLEPAGGRTVEFIIGHLNLSQARISDSIERLKLLDDQFYDPTTAKPTGKRKKKEAAK